jgi:hypothetical protein
VEENKKEIQLRKPNLSEWKVHELANYRIGIWRESIMLNSLPAYE